MCILAPCKKREFIMLTVNLLFDHSKWIFNHLPMHNIWRAWACFSPLSTLTLKLLEAERWLLKASFYFFIFLSRAKQPLSMCGSLSKASLPAAAKQNVNGGAPRFHTKSPAAFKTSVSTSTCSVNQRVDFNGPKRTSGCFQRGSDLWPKYSIHHRLARLQQEICNLLFTWVGNMETQ